MKRRGQALSLLFCGALICRQGVGNLFQAQPQIFPSVNCSDAESLFAQGRRLWFRRAGVYEIELIERVSDSIAFRVVRQRRLIEREARMLSYRQRWRAFTVVYGVGEKTAKKLAGRLRL